MSRKTRKNKKSAPHSAASSEAGTSFSGQKAVLARLLKQGKSRDALDFAKKLYEQFPTSESEAMLADAYCLRIQAMIDKNMPREALALAELAGKRLPDSRARLNTLCYAASAQAGSLDVLAKALTDPNLDDAARATAEDILRRELRDLTALAQCGALPADHPLRRGAAELSEAFSAVCAGPVADSVIALDGISRRSPLAPWKMLVRAIACFYRSEDARCRQCLDAIPAETAPARAGVVLRAILDGLRTQPRTPKEKALYGAVTGSNEGLRELLAWLDDEDSMSRPKRLVDTVFKALGECRRVYPEFEPRLRQHIAMTLFRRGFESHHVRALFNGAVGKDAYFWRLMARDAEMGGEFVAANGFWEEFRRQALRERLFDAGGVEEAEVYLRMAEVACRDESWRKGGMFDPFDDDYDDEDDYEDDDCGGGYSRGKKRRAPGPNFMFTKMDEHYAGESEEIRAGAAGRSELPFLGDATPLYRRACELQPAAANFRLWMAHASTKKDDTAEEVAELWSLACRDDAEPLLILAERAEKRNALKKALGYIERAESLDAIHPKVRQGRLRLLAATALRHAAAARPHLLEQDIEALESLPQLLEGDRAAFADGMRWVLGFLRGETDLAARRDAVDARLGGPLGGGILLDAIARGCKRKIPALASCAEVEETPLAQVVEMTARALAAARDFGLSWDLKPDARAVLLNRLSMENVDGHAGHLRILAESTERSFDSRLAYAAAGAALPDAQESELPPLLFLRARNMDRQYSSRQQRLLQAALALARKYRDSELLNKIVEYSGCGIGFLALSHGMDASLAQALGPEEVLRVVEDEKQARDREIGDRGHKRTVRHPPRRRHAAPKSARKTAAAPPKDADAGEKEPEAALQMNLFDMAPDTAGAVESEAHE